jgi:hypothetical protein
VSADGTAAVLAAIESMEKRLSDRIDSLRGSAAATTHRSAPGAGSGSATLVKFGRDKGKRLDEVADLSWYREAIAKGANDPAKSRWRDENLDLLDVIDREIARRTGAGSPAPDRGGYGGPPPGFDERPPPDDDVPF